MLGIHKNSKASAFTAQREGANVQNKVLQDKTNLKTQAEELVVPAAAPLAAGGALSSTYLANIKPIKVDSKVEENEKDRENKENNYVPMGILGGRKRVNRGYNPKYDSKDTEFVCKGDAQVQQPQLLGSAFPGQSKKLKTEGQIVPGAGFASVRAAQHSELVGHK